MRETQISNPYLDEVRKFPRNELEWEYRHIWKPEPYPWRGDNFPEENGKRITRDDLCGKYAWSIPDPASLQFVAQALWAKALEIGAGTGYYAHLLSQMGVDMLCFDLHPPQHTRPKHWHRPRNDNHNGLLGITREVFYDVRGGGPLIAAKHPDRALFLCWPPYEDEMAYHTLQAYQGQRLVYIGEGEGGCTADTPSFPLLASECPHV